MTGQQTSIVILALLIVNGFGYYLYRSTPSPSEEVASSLGQAPLDTDNVESAPSEAVNIEEQKLVEQNAPEGVTVASKEARERAVAALERGDYKTAISEFRTAIEQGDDSGATMRLLRTSQSLAAKSSSTSLAPTRVQQKVRRLAPRRRSPRVAPVAKAPQASAPPPAPEPTPPVVAAPAPAVEVAAKPEPVKPAKPAKQPEMERNPYLRGN